MNDPGISAQLKFRNPGTKINSRRLISFTGEVGEACVVLRRVTGPVGLGGPFRARRTLLAARWQPSGHS